MQDLPLFESAKESLGQPSAISVTELTSRIRGTLEPAFTDVWVQGEVSNYRPAPSGHAYFSLKDSECAISATCFGWGRRKSKFELKDGLQVLVRGRISVYPPRGTYQINIDQIEPLGAGALQLAFDQLKQKLLKEGLFEAARKRALPTYPRKIAIVTSPSGAAVRDMLTVLSRRAPQIEVLIIPALVQGDQAPAQIRRGLEVANQLKLAEIVVLARGGGSIEDLWAFNDEDLARAIAKSEIPVISAVGHEVDFSIADFVADLRAPTPSAAAEILSHAWMDARSGLEHAQVRLSTAIQRDLMARKQLLSHLAARLKNPRDRLREQAQRLDEWLARMERAIRNRIERRKLGLEQLAGKLDALSPLRVLERGFTIVTQTTGARAGQVVRSKSQLTPGDLLEVRFHDGKAQVEAK